MAVLQMQKMCICALKKDRKALLELLQAAGVMEITQEASADGVFRKEDTLETRQASDRNAAIADRALEVLEEYAPEKTSMFAGLEGKPLTDRERYEEIAGRADQVLEDANRILELQKQIAEQRTSVVRLETEAESLTPWLALDIPLMCRETGKTAILVGTVGGPMTLEELYTAVAEKAPELTEISMEIAGSSADQTCMAAVCLKKDAQALEDALRSIGFARPARQTDAVPAEYAAELRSQIEKLRSGMEEVRQQLELCGNSREDLRILSDYYRIRAQKYSAMGEILQSEKTILLTGYVPAREVKSLEEKLTSRFDAAIEYWDIPEDEEAPVLLSNGTFAASAEGVTASFGLPARGELDPTPIMSACYVFFFGLMLSDAAYGLIIFLACAFALKRFPRMEKNLQKAVRLFMYSGISTLFWGVMFGGYFGDAVDIISKTWFGRQITIPALWFAPLNNPMRLLIFSLLFGVIHLFLGLGIKGYMLLKGGKVMDFFCEVVLWYMMLIGLILMLIPSSLFAPMIQMQIVFPPVINAMAKWSAILGAVGIVLLSARDKKNPVLRLALGAYDLYNITGWLSDALSYSRLLALGLATGVIASVINQMGSMVGTGIFGTLAFIVIFCFGHLFNLAINLLGAYVHTCRLQYVEFFGKFYEGGGRPFEPFRRNTKYVEIKEDE